MIALPGQEAWKTKEGAHPEAELPGTGDLKTRGLMWEAMTAVALMLAGANIVVLRHPESARVWCARPWMHWGAPDMRTPEETSP